MTLFWKIFWTICAIWFLMLLFRPRTKEEWLRLEKVKEHQQEIAVSKAKQDNRWFELHRATLVRQIRLFCVLFPIILLGLLVYFALTSFVF